MARARRRIGLLSCLLLGGWVGTARAVPPTVAEMLTFKPKQDEVVCSTPTEAEQAACKVESVPGPGGKPSGWLLRDPRGQPLRRFFDADGDNKIDVWSYYLDGQEVYREMDTTADGLVDQYRWFGVAGMRWGVSTKQNGRIDAWRAISPEEVSQEVLRAVTKRDFARLQALMLTEAELKALDLPDGEAGRVRASLAAAGEKFQKTTAELIGLSDKTHWLHMEAQAPQCVPADALGGKHDLIHYDSGALLYENAGKHDWLQTGELILVGRAWRIVDAPVPGYKATGPGAKTGPGGPQVQVTKAIEPDLERLKQLDAAAPKPTAGPDPEVAKYNLARALILEQIAGKVEGEQREQWLRQVADCLSAAAQNSPANDRSSYDRLVALRDRIARAQPGGNLAAYVTFREMSADYAVKLANPPEKDMAKVQEAWRERLKKFVEAYPAAEDTPDALLQLGMVSEFVGKEAEAKNWYAHLAKHFAKHPLAAKAQGALRRMSLDGTVLELNAPLLGNRGTFEMGKLSGKVVIVYYWASWNQQCVTDFEKLKALLAAHASKGLELVCVNLDNAAGEAVAYLQKSPVPGTHLYQEGGLESPLAVNYGVMVLPNLFLVGRDGKVVSRSVQMGSLEDEVKKLIGPK